MCMHFCFMNDLLVLSLISGNCFTRVADKSLAQPGRKQATATKLGIYSTYSPRSSVHFLAHCSDFCKPLKKKSEICPSNQVSAAAMTSASDEKWWLFNCFLSPGRGCSPTGPDPENRVGDQGAGSRGRPVSSGLAVPGEPGHCRARTRPPWWHSRGFFRKGEVWHTCGETASVWHNLLVFWHTGKFIITISG